MDQKIQLQMLQQHNDGQRHGWMPPSQGTTPARHQPKFDDYIGDATLLVQDESVEVVPRSPPKKLQSFSGNLAAMPRHSLARSSDIFPNSLRDLPATIAKSIMLPHDTVPIRVVDRFSIVPTAVAQPWRIDEADFSSAAVSGAPLPSGSYFAASSRNPLSSLITYLPAGCDGGNTRSLLDFAVDANTPISVGLGYGGFATPWSFGIVSIGDNVVVSNLIGMETYTAGFSSVSSYHDGYLYANTSSAGSCVFLPSGTVIQVTRLAGPFWNSSTASTIRIILDKLEGESFVEVYDSLFTTGAALTGLTGRVYTDLTQYAALSVAVDGHYRLRCAWWNNAASAAMVVVGLEVRCYIYHAHYNITAMPGVRAHSSVVRRMRVNGHALMVSPYSASMFRGGRCAGRQLEDGISWVDCAKLVDQLISMPNTGDRPFSNGLYGFSKPSCAECLQMQPLFHYPVNASTLSNVGSGSVWTFNSFRGSIPNSLHNPVYPPGGWLVVAVEAALGELGSTTAYPSGRCHISSFYSIEFETTDTWLTIASPSTTPEAFDRGLAVVRCAQQWHDNKMHISDILRFVSNAANVGLKIAPTLAAGLRLFPATAAVGNALAIASTAATAAKEAIQLAKSDNNKGKKKVGRASRKK